MPFVPAAGIVKVSWFYTLNGQPAMNRMHVLSTTAAPTATICAGIAATAASWWINNAQALVHPAMALREVEATSLAVQNGPTATFSAGLPAAGLLGQPAAPGNLAFCVSLRTGLTGRSARGRWYWAGLTMAQLSENLVLSGTVTSIVAALDNLLSAMTTTTTFPVILSYVSNNAPRPGGPVNFGIVDALAVDNTVDSQRGRLH